MVCDVAVPRERRAGLALAGQQRDRAGRHAALAQRLDERERAAGRLLGGLEDAALPVASAAAVIPSGIASGKFQGEMTAVTPRGRVAQRVALAGRPAASGRAPVELDRASRVVLEEVDRLADVRVGLGPRLAALADGERGELGAALAQVAGGAQEGVRALLARACATTRRQRVARGGDRRARPRRASPIAAVATTRSGAPGRWRRAPRRRGGRRRSRRGPAAAGAASSSAERVGQPPALRRPAQLEHRLVGEGRETGTARRLRPGQELLDGRRAAWSAAGRTRSRCSRAAAARGRPCPRRGRRPGSRSGRGTPERASAWPRSSPRPRRTCSSMSSSGAPAARLAAIACATERRLCEAIATRTSGRMSSSRSVSALERAVALGLLLEDGRAPAVLAGLDDLVVPVRALHEPDDERRGPRRARAPRTRTTSSVSGASRR